MSENAWIVLLVGLMTAIVLLGPLALPVGVTAGAEAQTLGIDTSSPR